MKSRSFGSGISPACIAAGILRRGTEKRIGDFEGHLRVRLAILEFGFRFYKS
jgi:hypothetical protein